MVALSAKEIIDILIKENTFITENVNLMKYRLLLSESPKEKHLLNMEINVLSGQLEMLGKLADKFEARLDQKDGYNKYKINDPI
jgi:hypothetical protein